MHTWSRLALAVRWLEINLVEGGTKLRGRRWSPVRPGQHGNVQGKYTHEILKWCFLSFGLFQLLHQMLVDSKTKIDTVWLGFRVRGGQLTNIDEVNLKTSFKFPWPNNGTKSPLDFGNVMYNDRGELVTLPDAEETAFYVCKLDWARLLRSLNWPNYKIKSYKTLYLILCKVLNQ